VIPILLAAASAVVWGTADYAGGRATREADVLRVVVMSKLVSMPVLVAFLVLLGTAPLSGPWLGWGLAAGAVGLFGLVLFYRALASGAMAVAAPVSAVTTAVVPLTFGLLTEEAPEPLALVGVACAVGAIALISLVPHASGPVTARVVGLALAAGSGFGMFFVLLSKANDAAGASAGLWPVAAAQVVALAFGSLLLLRGRASGGRAPLRGGLLAWVAVAGVLDMSANALYLLATRDGLLSIVAPLGALYPVSTVLLALAIDRERLRPVQVAGLGLAVAALVLVAS
jgi:drug/metabolite transporter (DMT)-like permease